ncbi:MAG TPA: TonB-dependent receptor [Bacteroidota bacterium]
MSKFQPRASRSLLLGVLFLFFSFVSNAQPSGSVKGVVADSRSGEALPSVNLLLKGTQIGTVSNLDGGYEIKNIPEGTYILVVSLVGYESIDLQGIRIVANEVVVRDISLVEKSVQVADVVVYGASLRGERVTDAPASVTVLTPKDIKLSAVSGQLPKLLEGEQGVDIVQNGLNDYNVNTRGFNSSLNRRLLVLLDGRDLAVAFLGSQEWNGLSVPVEDLGKLELIRGPGSALYGANAFNGVINILTPDPKDIVGGKVTVAGGERSTFRTDIRYAGASPDFSYKINVGRFQGQSWGSSRLQFPYEYEGFNPFLNTEVVPIDSRNVSSTYGSGRADYLFENGSKSLVEGGITKVEREILVTGIGRVQVPKAIKPWARVNFSSEKFSVQVWGAWRNSLEPQVSLSTGLPLEEKSLISQIDMQYRISAMDDRLFVIFGGSHRYQTVDTKGTLTLSKHDDNLSGVYTQLEFKVTNDLKSVVAGRLDRSTLHSSQFSPKVALVWTPIPGHAIRGTFNRAFQAPNYSELFLFVKHPTRNLAYFGNEDLIVEKITGYEVGYKGVFGQQLFLTIDGYYNQLKDFITDLAPSVNPKYPGQVVLPGETVLRTIWSYGNAGKVNEYGAEVGINYYVTNHWQVNANYAFFEFEVKEQNANDILIPNAPRNKINGGVTYSDDDFSVGVTAKYVPAFDWAAGIYKGPIKPYTLINLNGTYALTPILDLGVNVTNLLDKSHYQIFGGSLIGRRAVMSLTAKF